MDVRLYDPNLGRFLSVDPVDGGSANNYDYTSGDPVTSFDLAGTFCVTGKNQNGSCRSIARGAKRHAGEQVIRAAVIGVAACLLSVACGVIVAGSLGLLGAGAAAIAEAEAPVIAGRLTGYTSHNLNHVIGRDGGLGVSPSVILEALRSGNFVDSPTDE